MKRLAVVAVVVGGGFGLACGGGGDITAPVVIPVAPAVPEPVPEPTPAPVPAPVEVGSRCPEGVHAPELWQGEYPSPVVDVKSAVALPARAKPCDGAATLTCTVAPGVYHPWADVEASFATLRPILRFKARRAWKGRADDGSAVAAEPGEEVQVAAYFGEGFCQWIVDGKEVANLCPEMLTDDQGEIFEAVPAPAFTEVQVFGVDCGGQTGWVDVDDALFARPEVAEGVILEYGKVGPEGSGQGL